MNSRRAIRIAVLLLPVLWFAFFTGSNSSAAIVSFQVLGTADLTLDGTFHSAEDFQITFSVDDAEPDQMPFDPSRGAFSNVTVMITLLDNSLMVPNAVALNVNGIRQDQNPHSLFLVNDSNFFNPAFSITLPAGSIPDVNQIQALTSNNLVGIWTGAGLNWQLDDGQTLAFNQVTSMTISNFQSVPEPRMFLVILMSAVWTAVRRTNRRTPTQRRIQIGNH